MATEAAAGLSRSARVARNTALLSAAQLGTRLFSVGYFWLVATRLGPAAFGSYQVVLNLMSVFVPIADGGLATATARDLARRPALDAVYRYPSFFVLTVGSGFGYLCLIATVLTLNLEPGLAALAGLALLPQNVIAFVSSLFNARERMEATALLQLTPLVLMMALGAAALLAGWGLAGVVTAYVVAHVAAAALALGFQRFLPAPQALPWREVVTVARGRWRAALPYGLQALCAQLYVRMDLLFLKDAVPAADLGAYAAAMRLLEAPLLLPSLMTAALVPLAATLHASSRDTLRDVFERQSRLLAVVGIGAAAALAMLAPEVMRLFGKDYAASGPLLRIMSLALIFGYLSLPITMVVTTSPSQRRVTILSFVSVGLGAVAYLIGITLDGATGAAWAKLAATASSLVLFYPVARHLLGPTRALGDLVRPFAAGAVAFLPLWLLTGNDLLTIGLGAPLFLALILVLRVFDARDRDLFRRLVRRR